LDQIKIALKNKNPFKKYKIIPYFFFFKKHKNPPKQYKNGPTVFPKIYKKALRESFVKFGDYFYILGGPFCIFWVEKPWGLFCVFWGGKKVEEILYF
jgi:hypothetical protein